MACPSWNVVTAPGEAPDVISDRMNVAACTPAGELSVAWVIPELSTLPPAEPRYSMKLQVSPSYEAPCQTYPYLVSPAFLILTASASSSGHVVGTARCSLASRSFR